MAGHILQQMEGIIGARLPLIKREDDIYYFDKMNGYIYTPVCYITQQMGGLPGL